MQRRAIRRLAAMTVFALALVACGQKPNVHIGGVAAPDAGAQQPAGGTTTGGQVGTTATTGDAATTETTTTTETTQAGAGTTGGTTTTTGGDTTSGGATTGGDTTSGGATTGGDTTGGDTTGGATSGGSTGQSGGQRPVRGSDRTGVTAEVIKLAGHAPVTGAAPLPTTSFEKALDTYWKWLESKEIFPLGRKIDIQFRDDKYDPNSARQVCRELEAEVFTLSGGGGTDQIQACGQLAEVAEFPYTSAGVTEAGLRGNPWYFATSMSYKQQGLLLAQMLNKYFPGKKTAMIVTDTPNFDDAVQGWMAGVQQQGIPYYDTLKHPKGDTSWYNSFAAKLYEQNVEVVYILSSPVDYIRFAQQAAEQGPGFQYVGVGISMGLNAVLGSGCPQVGGGMFFSPFPGLDWAQENEPEFFQASQELGKPADDIALALWANNKIAHELLNRYGQIYGNDLTREDFRDMVETQTNIDTGVFPTLNYSPDDHFGASQAHLLKADCTEGAEQYRTVETFVSSF